MSAFLVDTEHIDALLTAGLAYCDDRNPLTWYHALPEDDHPDDMSLWTRQLTSDTAGRVGAMLLAENARSANYAHQRNEWEPAYLYRELPGLPDPVVVLKAISCLQRQSCEHPDWPDSEAFAFCGALQRKAITRLPGWNQLTNIAWPIQDRAIFEQPRPK